MASQLASPWQLDSTAHPWSHYPPPPAHLLQVVNSMWHSNALPSRGEHVREPDALALMMHVLDCVRALR